MKYLPENAGLEVRTGWIMRELRRISSAIDTQFDLANDTHPLILGRSVSDQHPQSAITGLELRLDTDEQNLADHEADLNNPHQVGYEQAGAAPLVHLHIETDITDLDRVRWRNEWAQQQYYKNDWALEGAWGGVANKDTEDHLAPQYQGDPIYGYQGTLTPYQQSAKQIFFGTRYLSSVAVFLQAFRVDTVAGNVYQIFLVEDPNG
ncbi:MAG: hypothetical protein DRI65_14385, partial [Chloroflexota bacterium]